MTGRDLRQLRIKLHMTQTSLAGKLKISLQYLCLIESKETELTTNIEEKAMSAITRRRNALIFELEEELRELEDLV